MLQKMECLGDLTIHCPGTREENSLNQSANGAVVLWSVRKLRALDVQLIPGGERGGMECSLDSSRNKQRNLKVKDPFMSVRVTSKYFSFCLKPSPRVVLPTALSTSPPPPPNSSIPSITEQAVGAPRAALTSPTASNAS